MDTATLAHMDQLLAEGANGFRSLIAQVRTEVADTDSTRATLTLIQAFKADPEQWDLSALAAHLAVALVSAAQRAPDG